MKEYLNRSVKFREPFRPYAASVLEEQAHSYFELLQPDPFMLTVVDVAVPQRDAIASVCHVDQTCRVQTVSASSPGGYRQLLEAFFRLTGLPLILDTSLNVRGEPIVETPEDAINCFLSSNFDVLYLEGRRITKTRIAELSVAPCGHLIPCLNVLKQISCRQEYDGGRWSQPVHVVTTRTGHGRTVPKAQADVLAAIDGARSISQIAAELRFSTFEPVAEICEQLQADGLISFRRSLSLTSALEASS
jgi:carbamoyltransferase